MSHKPSTINQGGNIARKKQRTKEAPVAMAQTPSPETYRREKTILMISVLRKTKNFIARTIFLSLLLPSLFH